MQIAIQGALGSFHHEAAVQLDPTATIIPLHTFADVFHAVEAQAVDYGLCAIENTLYGPIDDVYDLLEQHHIWISSDIQLQISQHLIGPSKISLEELADSNKTRVLSQAPALKQAEHWLATYLPNAIIEATYDTAASVQTIVDLAQPHTVAIAGRLAASTYNGTIIAKNIQDNPNNYTRFILFSHNRQSVQNATSAVLMLQTDGNSDTLANALQVLANANCSPIRAKSRPAFQEISTSITYIDCPIPSNGIGSILSSLKKQGYRVKLLGEYSLHPVLHTT